MTNIEPIILSVSEFNDLVNSTLGDNIGEALVQGEISDLRFSQGKWVSFSLKDEESILPCFAPKEKISIPLEEGIKVKILGRPRIYAKRGLYSFQIIAVQAIGEGSIKKAFQELLIKLEKEGLFRQDLKLPLPEFPDSIGIITSLDGAAITDVKKILSQRWGDFKLFIKPVNVQGIKSEQDVINAINYFNHHLPVDVIILTRGGGSMEDLQAFNSELMARSVFASKIPIIAAIGHERDITIVELVADKRASTPSNAAQLAVPDRRNIELKLNDLESRAKLKIQSDIKDFDHLIKDAETLAAKILEDSRTRIKELLNLLNSLSPEKVLERGYTITRDLSGKIIKQAKLLKKGDKIETIFHDSKITSEVL